MSCVYTIVGNNLKVREESKEELLMNEISKNRLKILIAYIDIVIILLTTVISFKIIELLLTEYGNPSLNSLHILWVILPLSYFIYRLYNNPKLNKEKASGFIFILGIIYFFGNIFLTNTSITKTSYVAITSNISSETKDVYYGDGREQEVHTNPFKIEGLFSLKNDFKYYIDDIQENNEVVLPLKLNYYQTGIILGFQPINFKLEKNKEGIWGEITNSFSYGWYFLLDVIFLSMNYFFLVFIILTLYQFYNQRKRNILTPNYYFNLFKE